MRWLWPRMQRVSPVAAAPWVASFFATISASKKSLHAAEQKRADVARARRRWIREQGMLDPARLVFIDETATSTNMVRLRGRCPRGERLVASVPHGHWETITFVAGLRHDGIVAPFVIDGAMNGPIFLAWVNSPQSLPDLDWGDCQSAGVCHRPCRLDAHQGMARLNDAPRIGVWITARA